MLPVGIRGAFDSLPRTRRVPRRGKIEIHVGNRIVFPGSPWETDPPAREIAAFKNLLQREVMELAGQQPADLADEASTEPARQGATGEARAVDGPDWHAASA